MKNFRSKGGPTKTRPFYTTNEIEDVCTGELEKFSLLPSDPEPIRIDRFIEKKFNVSPQYEILPDGLLGFTKFGTNGVESISIARALDEEGTKVAERRIRTTLAHEAGHGLLHSVLFVFEKQSKNLFNDGYHDDTPRVLCRDEANFQKLKGYDGKWWEHQANLAMSALLLPKILVHKAIQPYLKTQGMLGGVVIDPDKKESAIIDLSKIFDVNPIVVRLRLDQLFPLTNTGQLSL